MEKVHINASKTKESHFSYLSDSQFEKERSLVIYLGTRLSRIDRIVIILTENEETLIIFRHSLELFLNEVLFMFK